MPKLSKPKSFSSSNETIEVNFQGTISECANLLKSGIINQNIILVAHNDKWHEINILDLGGDNSNLQDFKNFIETMKLSLVDLGITTETAKRTSTVLTHDDFMMLSEKFPPHDYIQISQLNDYNIKSGWKSSIDVLTDDLKVCQRDGIPIKELIEKRELNKLKIIKNMKTELIELDVVENGKAVIPTESIVTPINEIEVHEAVLEPSIELVHSDSYDLPKTPAKKPVSVQVFENFTPERISELIGLKEKQLQIVKENPVVKTITDKTSYELAKKTAAILLKASTSIDGKEGVDALGVRCINAFKKMFSSETSVIAKISRDPYDEQKTIISSWENAELLKQQAEQRVKLEKIKKRTDELFAVPFTFNGSIYSIGTVYCTPSQVETATDEDFLIIVNNGKTIKQALIAEQEIQSGKDKEIAELKAKLAALTVISEMSNTEPETQTVIESVQATNNVETFKTADVPVNNSTPKPTTSYVLPAQENKLLNRLDLENVEHLEKPAYIKCRGFYVRGLIDTAKEIEFILNDATPNTVKKSERISNLCEILKKSV